MQDSDLTNNTNKSKDQTTHNFHIYSGANAFDTDLPSTSV
jgi:hypothetical protein